MKLCHCLMNLIFFFKMIDLKFIHYLFDNIETAINCINSSTNENDLEFFRGKIGSFLSVIGYSIESININ